MRTMLRMLGRAIIWSGLYVGGFTILMSLVSTFLGPFKFTGGWAVAAVIVLGQLGVIARDIAEVILPSIEDREF